jgi:hypothetical protein
MKNAPVAPLMDGVQPNGHIVSEELADDACMLTIASIRAVSEENPEKARQRQLLERFESLKVDVTKELAPPEVCLHLLSEGEPIILTTLGNLSLINGQAKSKKTFLVSIALAAACSNNSVLGRFRSSLPSGKRRVIFVDTEQSEYHVIKTAKRVMTMAGENMPGTFEAYSLDEVEDRAEMIDSLEAKILTTPDLGFIVIDNIRDFLDDPNDIKASNILVRKLKKLAKISKVHIMCVIHQNKNNDNAGGWLGKEIVQKAESVISLTKDSKNPNMSIVKHTEAREKPFADFAFEIDIEGMPQIVEGWNCKDSNDNGLPKSLEPQAIPKETHLKILKVVYKNHEAPKMGELIPDLKAALSAEGVKISDPVAKQYIAWYSQNSFLTKEGSTPHTRYKFIHS